MPFTVAHALAAAPFARRPFVFSALVIGAMSPDALHLLRRLPEGWFWTTWRGFAVVCVGGGLAALWIWHALMKSALVELTPGAHFRRLTPHCGRFEFGPPRRFVMIVTSLLIGGFSHLLWDGFTHSYGWFVTQIPLLEAIVLESRWGPLYVYKVLQHGSTLVGFVGLWWWYCRWYRRAEVNAARRGSLLSGRVRATLVSIFLLMTIISAFGVAWLAWRPLETFESFTRFVVSAAVVGFVATGAQMLVFSIAWRVMVRVPRSEAGIS